MSVPLGGAMGGAQIGPLNNIPNFALPWRSIAAFSCFGALPDNFQEPGILSIGDCRT